MQPGRHQVNVYHANHHNNHSLYTVPHGKDASASLPQGQNLCVVRYLRYTLLTVYRRVFTFIVVLNLIPLYIVLHQRTVSLDTLATAASTNILIAIFVRQDVFINGIYRTAWIIPWRVPLAARKWIARCYCYGGIHSGAAMAGTAWWIGYSVMLTLHTTKQKLYTVSLLATAWTILAILALIIVLALPGIRKAHHNIFELTHRFMGWTSILLFWGQLLLVVNQAAPPAQFLATLLCTPTFWNLICITALILYPWLTLRTWMFYPTVLSSHAIRLHFVRHVHKFSCLSISTSPLREWHPFATFPSISTDTQPSPPENSILISDAGDWTHALIRHAQSLTNPRKTHHPKNSKPQPPVLRLWVKSTPTPGVLSLTTLFSRVVLITTGSGIGPCLSSLLVRPATQLVRLVWSTRAPTATYGAELVSTVYAADPGALVVDTDAMGRPDLVRVGYALFHALRAEAVFVLSNEEVTRRVVYGLRCRGVTALGPVFDS